MTKEGETLRFNTETWTIPLTPTCPRMRGCVTSLVIPTMLAVHHHSSGKVLSTDGETTAYMEN